MRSLSVVIDRNGAVTTDTQMLGYGGEHNASQLVITFDQAGYERFSALDYFRIVIDGNYSEDLYLIDQVIRYTVPEITMQPPEVQCQVLGYKIEGGEPSVIVKSGCFKLLVDCSEVPKIEAKNEPDILEKTVALCTEAAISAKESVVEVQEAVDSVMVAAQSVERNADLAESSARYAARSAESAEESARVLEEAVWDYNNISNSLKGKAAGREVSISDISPLSHNVEVQLQSKNMYNPVNTLNAYINGGKVVAGGVTHALVYAECVPGETYTVSKTPGQRFSVQFTENVPQNGVDVYNQVTNYTASSITVVTPANAKYIAAFVYNGNLDTTITREEMLSSVQIEKGSVATEYTPFYVFEESTVILAENKLYEVSDERGLFEMAECQSVKNYTVEAKTVDKVFFEPCIRNGESLSNAAVMVESDYGAIDVTYTIEGAVVSWNGTTSECDVNGNVLSTVEVSGSYTVEGLTGSESYFTGWYIHSDSGSSVPKCIATVTFDTGARDVNVVTIGKNVFNINGLGANHGGAISSISGNSITITQNSTAKFSSALYYLDENDFIGKKVSVSLIAKTNGANIGFFNFAWIDADTRNPVRSIASFTVTSTEMTEFSKITELITKPTGNVRLALYMYSNTNADLTGAGPYSCEYKDIQFEFSEAPTEYEPYHCDVYTVDVDGKVVVQSKYPYMQIKTDNKNVSISTQYNMDLNKAFERLYNAVIALGGSV